MKPFLQLLMFGTASGLAWSLAPMILSDLARFGGQTISVLCAGALTGIAVTLALAWPLRRCGRGAAIAIGTVSLPLGAFLFGVIVSWIHLGLALWPGVTYRFIAHGFRPFGTGLGYAIGALVPLVAIVFIPSAVVTTLLLHRMVHRVDANGSAPAVSIPPPDGSATEFR